MAAERAREEALRSAFETNSIVFILVLFLLALTTGCLISYKERQDADKAPDLVFKRNENIYRQSDKIHLMTSDFKNDYDDEDIYKVKSSTSIN